MSIVKFYDKKFISLISEEEIELRVKELAKDIQSRYSEEEIIHSFVLMNGAFIFAADLTRHLKNIKLYFIKSSSYQGLSNDGVVKIESFDFSIFKNQRILIIEDIIDTGKTMNTLIGLLQKNGIPQIDIVTLILKPNKLEYNFENLMIGFEISNEFIIGYGMDYKELGRNLKDIYQIHLPDRHIE